VLTAAKYLDELNPEQRRAVEPTCTFRLSIGIIASLVGVQKRYGEAAAKAPPHAIQVADRWHLMQNASRAFLDAVRKSMR
jgi:transposase